MNYALKVISESPITVGMILNGDREQLIWVLHHAYEQGLTDGLVAANKGQIDAYLEGWRQGRDRDLKEETV